MKTAVAFISTAVFACVAAVCCCSSAFPAEMPGKKENDQRTLDDVFNEALYLYCSRDVVRAFELMDTAIGELPPTEDWQGHLRLYKKSFDVSHENFATYDKHSDKATAFINDLKKKPDKTDKDLVRLATIAPTAAEFQPDLPTASELCRRFPESPWAAWARWMIIEYLARNKMRVVRTKDDFPFKGDHYGLPFNSSYAVQVLADGATAELRKIKDSDSSSIMRKYLTSRLIRLISWHIYMAKRDYDFVCAMLPDKPKAVDLEGLTQEMAQPVMELSDRILSSADKICWDVFWKPERREALWDYYEELRRSGVRLPESIPTDKATFQGNVSPFRYVEDFFHEKWLKENEADEE